MTKLKTHIGFKISLMLLVTALLVPSFVKLAHAFENHKHEVCKTPQKSHYHELDLNCEFYKFKLSKSFSLELHKYVIASIYQSTLVTNFYEPSHSNLSVEQTFLRGPPELI